MKTIELIGGMSWKSTIPYYSIINEYINEKLGGFHSARIILYSVEFDENESASPAVTGKRARRYLAMPRRNWSRPARRYY